jgi:hypothetical protein
MPYPPISPLFDHPIKVGWDGYRQHAVSSIQLSPALP